jgi:ArsR family transcriptional regulator
MSGIESVLDTLGSQTRRRILFLLAERPRFVTELSEQLRIGRKAIIEHLSLMENSGLVFSAEKRLSQGRPRKYFEIKREIFFNVGICPSFVDFSQMESKEEIEEIEKLDMELDEIETTPMPERRISVSYIVNKLESRMEALESEWIEVQRLLNRARKMLK